MRILPKACAVAMAAAFLAFSSSAPAQEEEPRRASDYVRRGTIELGGAAHFMVAKDYSSFGLYPTIGWFVLDNIELSAILGVTRVGQSVRDDQGNEQKVSRTQLLVLAEPSFHVPFSDAVFGFMGLGLGLAHEARTPGPGAGPGFCVAPRLGLNFVINHSGVFTPAIQASYQTTDAMETPGGGSLSAHSSLGFQAGYTVIW